ncbi:MAG: tetratricopeptide repeat protein [Deltaproteobacteria bacterium]|nr:tetratricopeptide repeat protein [Deltaproteobacteria bacterium]
MRICKPNQILIMAAAMAAVLLLGSSGAWAQTGKNLTKMMIQSYDLLEAGKVDEAQKIYEQMLKEDPGNPLALNNLGAVMVKKGKYQEALAYLQQALPQAKGYKVMVNRVCEVGGVCLAFRPLQEVYGNQELEPLIRLNIQMIRGKMAAPGPGK